MAIAKGLMANRKRWEKGGLPVLCTILLQNKSINYYTALNIFIECYDPMN